MVLAAPVIEVASFGLARGAVYALLALGLVLIYRTTGVTNFAHWGLGLFGLVAYFLLTSKAGMSPVLAAILSVLLAGASGAASYQAVFRHVKRTNQVVLILIALGVAQFAAVVAQMLLGFEATTLVEPWLPVSRVNVGNAAVFSTQIVAAGAAIAIAMMFLPWFRYSRTGRALRAVAQNREAASLAGIDEHRYSTIAWAIGSALAGLALLLIIPFTAGDRGGVITAVETTPFGNFLIPAFGAALVGGLVNLPLAVVGGFVFGIAQEMMILAPSWWSTRRSVVAAILIVILLLAHTERFFVVRAEQEALEA
ncbi:MAG TPA: branched-chain amino acid ABC transporter permease [Actinomycetota bacterium]|nr:branched-chain amino acid ABC transporter permease [Actinomycetota bacterium]